MSGADFLRDARAAVHGLRGRRWRAAVIVLLLALAIGGNAVVFSVADALVFHRVPYREGHRLVQLGANTSFGWSAGLSVPAVSAWRAQHDLFDMVFAYDSRASTYVKPTSGPRFVPTAAVEPGLFEQLGAATSAGRTFRPADLQPGADAVAVVSADLAEDLFGSNTAALGRSLMSGTGPVRVVGVLPATFRFPTGAERIWLPLDVRRVSTTQSVPVIARLAAGETLAAAARAVTARVASIEPADRLDPSRPRAVRLLASVDASARLGRLSRLIGGAAAGLLLVVLANIANLESASAVARARDRAVRLALGASRISLIRTAAIEGLALATAGTAAGWWVASLTTTWLAATLPASVTNPLTNRIDIDARALFFIVCTGLGTWIAVAAPLVVAAGRSPRPDALRWDGRTSAATPLGTRVRHALMAFEVVATTVLLVAAAINIDAYQQLLHLPNGLDPTNLLAINVRQPPDATVSDGALEARVLGTLQRSSDVVASALCAVTPPDSFGGGQSDLLIDGRLVGGDRPTVNFYSVGIDYFAAVRQPITDGRRFNATDTAAEVIVDELFARRYFPGRSAVGHHFRLNGISLGGASTFTIVGVAAHARTAADGVTLSELTLSLYQVQRLDARYPPLAFVARVSSADGAARVAGELRGLAPAARLRLARVSDAYAQLFADEAYVSSTVAAFGSAALVIALAGVYAVMAVFVATRQREVGIRMALGADRAAVHRLVLGAALRPVAFGGIVGSALALVGARLLGSLYPEVSRSPGRTIALTAVAVFATALAACWPPARAAGRLDPARLLRE